MPVDRQAALDLRLNHNLTYPEIAKIQGVSKQAIHQQIHHLIPTEQTAEYKINRADILSHQQLRLLSFGLTDDKLEKISPRDAAVSFGILYDKERLERGQSTENVEVHTITTRRAEIKARREELLARRELSTVGTAANNDASIRNDTT